MSPSIGVAPETAGQVDPGGQASRVDLADRAVRGMRSTPLLPASIFLVVTGEPEGAVVTLEAVAVEPAVTARGFSPLTRSLSRSRFR